MDMTLAEQLVWAAVFAAERARPGEEARRRMEVGRTAMYATKASQAVDDIRCEYKSLMNKHSKLYGTMSSTDLERLRQMTFKAED